MTRSLAQEIRFVGYQAGTPLDAILTPRFLPDSTLGDQNASTTITLPDQIVLGAAYQLTPKFKVLFDYQRVNWKVFDELVLNFELAGQRTLVESYRASKRISHRWRVRLRPSTTFRAGFLTHTAAAPNRQ